MKQLFIVLLNIYVNAFCEEINLSFPTDVGPVYSGLRIIGGKDVVPHTYPFVVGVLLKRNNHSYFCGGTLLTTRYVLTAAHCIDPKPEKIGVFLGRHNVSVKSGEIIMAQSIIVHERWNYSTVLNDIGLIKLNKNATLNENVSTVEISKTYHSYLGQVGTMLGWGKDEHSKQSHVLKSVDSNIISNKECSKTYRVSPSHLCTAGTDIRGSCQGDSGGPILVDGIQVGIVSFGALNCTAGYPSVFTRVSGYHQWIEDKIKGSASTRITSGAVTILVAGVSLFRLIMIL